MKQLLKERLVLSMLTLLMPLGLLAQDIKVQGIVKDETGETVIGASVMQKGTTNGAVTDIDGNFSLTVPSKATLLVSYIGFTTQEIAVDGRTQLEITLKEDDQTLNEVVVVGYGTMDKKELKAEVTTTASDVAITAWPPKVHTMTTFAKRVENKDVFHFLNFTNTDDLSWRDVNGTRPAPTLKTNIPVTVKVARPVGKLWVASPDIDGGAVKELSFSQNGSDLSFILPSVEYWTMAVVEYKNVEDNIFITGDGVQTDKSIAWSIKDGIQMIKGDNNVFTATAYITKGKPFKFVTVSTESINREQQFI